MYITAESCQCLLNDNTNKLSFLFILGRPENLTLNENSFKLKLVFICVDEAKCTNYSRPNVFSCTFYVGYLRIYFGQVHR